MIHEKDTDKFRFDVEQGMPPGIAAYPIVARGVFGLSSSEVLDSTQGKVGHFYYIYLLVQYVLCPFLFWLGPKNPDPPIRDFMIGYLGYGLGNWLSGFGLLWLCVELALAVSLRVLFYPVGSDGKADWRWRQVR